MGFIVDLNKTVSGSGTSGDGSSLANSISAGSATSLTNGGYSLPISLTIVGTTGGPAAIDMTEFAPYQVGVEFFGPDSNNLYPDEPLYVENPYSSVGAGFESTSIPDGERDINGNFVSTYVGSGILVDSSYTTEIFPRPNTLVKGWIKVTYSQTFSDPNPGGTTTTVTTVKWFTLD